MDKAALGKRVQSLREEIAEIEKQEEDYARLSNHSVTETRKHDDRVRRLDEIVQEVAALKKKWGVQ